MEFDPLFAVTALALAVLLFSLVSERLSQTVITPPMVFVLLGILSSRYVADVLNLHASSELIKVVAELTLVLVLFSDASRIDFRSLRHEAAIPARLLGIGLPLTILMGALLGWAMFPWLGFWEAAVLATILAPTDAALGQAVVSNRHIPVRIRQALNVESGLNDGIALPFLLLAITIADVTQDAGSVQYWVQFAGRQLVLGPIVGILVGYVGGKVVQRASDSGWMSGVYLRLSALALVLIAYGGAELTGGNGFIAAFVAGLTMGNVARKACSSMHEFAETEGQLLALLTFFFFGAVMVPVLFIAFDPTFLVYAVLSLTVVRMVPVVLANLGLKLRWETHLFLGWFGPRGIASVVYALTLFENGAILGQRVIFDVAILTVLLSVFAHGLTAVPGANWYARRFASMEQPEDMAEAQPAPEMPLRIRS